MKKNTFLVLTATAACSFLFYRQSYGINYLVFSVLLTLLFGLSKPQVTRQLTWRLAAMAFLLSGFITALNGSFINLLMNLGGMGLLTYVTVAEELSVITGVFYAFISSLFTTTIDAFVRIQNYIDSKPGETPATTKKQYKWYYLVLPLAVLIVFILLYRNASGAFTHLTNQIDLSFISIAWIAFTFFGFQLIFGMFNPAKLFNFFKREKNIPNNIQKNPRWVSRGFNITGITLFAMLNVLLLLVNITDMAYMFFTSEADINHAQLIHQGIAALSVSVVFAIVFILVWLNQVKADDVLVKKLKTHAMAWVVLNMVLVATNGFKNYEYIAAYGLTYLRIGVFFFLTLALLTLVFCWVKISGYKTNFFMYRRFGLVLLLTCLLFNVFNWDKIIARYNISQYKNHTLEADASYMLSLSDDCLPMIYDNLELLGIGQDTYTLEKLNRWSDAFMQKFEEQDWRSHSLNDYMVYDYLKKRYADMNTATSGL